ncbi:PREDICTED: uncharacterized protein LOC109581275 [Amphimedon queenslandica]|uniref:Uncharacterized protein n=2 Tax=Amphimedon queenslandica TaxID=400682 RepID=A0AAN0J266_AMPQE|nr:PREDICTED: uncharacterized protein LOC109581275 [Amphimedon queenslandica]|eukprot:XP_019850811.1 PREDICTED: uncharacterized protein LOC109581275 [Amphimedon queenslandica]
MLDSTIKVKVTPMLLINCGLPSSRKTTALKKLLQAASDLKAEDGIGFCDVYAARNLLDNKIVFMSPLQKTEEYSLVMYAGVENLARSSDKRIRVRPSHFSGFSNQDLNDHFTAIIKDLHKKYLIKQHDEPTEWDQSHTCGLALINVWDLGLNKIPTYVLSCLAGHLYNSHVWMFLDLLRDVDHLYEVPDIPENYSTSRNDRELIMRWRSRIRYFVRFAKLASMKNGNRKKVCSIIASYNGSKDLEEKMEKLRNALSTVSKQLGLQDLIDIEKLEVFHNEDIDPLYNLLQKKIKDSLEYHTEEIPLSFWFLRSFFIRKIINAM